MRACILTVAALILAGSTGCQGINLAHRGTCDQCGAGGHAQHAGAGHFGHRDDRRMAYGPSAGHGGFRGTPGIPHHQNREYYGPPGPTAAQVAYPYYTTRGPRDFLVDNPPSIGR